jgi:hypothetical protein
MALALPMNSGDFGTSPLFLQALEGQRPIIWRLGGQNTIAGATEGAAFCPSGGDSATCQHKLLAIVDREAHRMHMTAPKFANGQVVNFTPSFSQDSRSATGPYEILRQMPIEGGDETTYRIKSQTSGQERIAREHQLENAL